MLLNKSTEHPSVRQEDMKVLLRVATAPGLSDNGAILDDFLTTESWRTLITFAQEMAREYNKTRLCFRSANDMPSAAQRPSTSAPTMSTSTMPDDIPPELYVEFARGGAGGGSIKTCPHCTFENTHGGSDCEVCGLPL